MARTDAAPPESRPAEPYVDVRQQREAAIIGMYLFLATEIMLFGGLFATIFVVRMLHSPQVVEASKRLHLWIGAINTAVLLTSSLAVAAAVQAARAGRPRPAARLLAVAMAFGAVFLAVKAYEYSREYAEGLLPVFSDPPRFAGPVDHLFMNLYLIATSLHALHVTGGIVLLGVFALRLAQNSQHSAVQPTSVEAAGLYWHFVDVVWVFLYPVLYLAR